MKKIINIKEIKDLLKCFNYSLRLRVCNKGVLNIYILVENFSEKDYYTFQEELFKIIDEKDIMEIDVIEFYRQFRIYIRNNEIEFEV